MAARLNISVSNSKHGDYKRIAGAQYWYPDAYGNSGFFLVDEYEIVINGFLRVWDEMCCDCVLRGNRVFIRIESHVDKIGTVFSKCFSVRPIEYIEKTLDAHGETYYKVLISDVIEENLLGGGK